MPLTLRQNLSLTAAALERHRIAAPRLSAEVLLAEALGRERAYLYAHPEAEPTPEQQARFDGWITRRAAGTPQQYLTGWQEFYGRRFAVSPAVLIPRPETELVVQAALERLPLDASARIADVGTGSGCIAITLALERPRAQIIATDISPAALAIAGANARRLGAAVSWVRTDLLGGVTGDLDLVISNPPYLAEAELETLSTEVRDHEPRSALVAGPTGTEAYARLIPQARARLRPGGWLVLELGYASSAPVRALLGSDWTEVETRPDLQGWERVLLARAA